MMLSLFIVYVALIANGLLAVQTNSSVQDGDALQANILEL